MKIYTIYGLLILTSCSDVTLKGEDLTSALFLGAVAAVFIIGLFTSLILIGARSFIDKRHAYWQGYWHKYFEDQYRNLNNNR